MPIVSGSSPVPAPASARGRSSRALVVLVGLLLALAPVAYLAVARGSLAEVGTLDEEAGGQVEYLPDPTGRLSWAEVVHGEVAGQFRTLAKTGEPPTGGHWLRLTIPSRAGEAAPVIVEFANQYLDEARAYPPDGRSEGVQRTGQRIPMNRRSVRSHLPAVTARLAAGEATVLWVEMRGTMDSPSTVRVWRSAEDFRRYEQRQFFPLALYFGLWAALFVYNIFVYVTLRDRVVLSYLGYVAAIGALMLVGTNFSAYFFTGPAGLAREAAVFVLLLLGNFALLHFTRVFLETARLAPRAEKGLRALQLLTGLAVAAVPPMAALGWLPAAARLLYLLALGAMLVLPLVGIWLWVKRCRQAPLYVIAYGCLVAGLGWTICAQIGLVPPDHTNGAPFLIGSALELLLLGIAVAHRYRLILDEQERLQASYTARLESAVTARTQELLVANTDKDRLISVIAHDVRSPLTSLLLAGHALARDPARRPPEEIALAARAMQERCAELVALVDNLLDWGRLRSGATTRAPADLNVGGLVAEAMQPLRVAADSKQLRILAEIPGALTVCVDGYAVQCVLRNLIGNAIKFTPPAGTVRVTAQRSEAGVELRVADSGAGMSAETLSEISAERGTASGEGTAGERGLGLGLSLCRELVAREGGTLEFESTPLRGTTVRITLPAAA